MNGPTPSRLPPARPAGYRIEGIYLGTESPTINVERIERAMLRKLCRWIDPARVPAQRRESLSNLAQTVEQFDRLQMLDNSRDDPPGRPRPVEQCRLERGRVVERLDAGDMAAWCAAWLAAQ